MPRATARLRRRRTRARLAGRSRSRGDARPGRAGPGRRAAANLSVRDHRSVLDRRRPLAHARRRRPRRRAWSPLQTASTTRSARGARVARIPLAERSLFANASIAASRSSSPSRRFEQRPPSSSSFAPVETARAARPPARGRSRVRVHGGLDRLTLAHAYELRGLVNVSDTGRDARPGSTLDRYLTSRPLPRTTSHRPPNSSTFWHFTCRRPSPT